MLVSVLRRICSSVISRKGIFDLFSRKDVISEDVGEHRGSVERESGTEEEDG
jgi:hypothetical protein